ncbi:hypothetical protein [Adhaeretor mobilis]|uniref:Glycosyltransferase family 1 protein n=1 Tax=Adhaeretor mobilis TaxID=1930276 RepID=A0A517MZW6_9BACT|nr:hypothetical protein [Adhaeretor mobilis]QDT00427.1 hypothetical protein HG15A2_37650 [Adhaeretor mobilis]
MVEWLVIGADAKPAGRGVRGLALVWFLRTYHGRRAVRYLEPKDLLSNPSVHAQTVFLGLPTSLTAQQIADLPNRTGCQRIVAFDYFDQHELAWSEEQGAAFRSVGEVYLKPWKEPIWESLPEYANLQMGTLPIRRYGRFTWARRIDRLNQLVRTRPEPEYDAAFLGRPNHTRFYMDGKIHRVDQRVDWMLDLKRNAPDLKVWGGLVEVNDKHRQVLEEKYGDVSDLLYQGSKVNFAKYWKNLCRSRVALAPGGNVPWTYRHYECLYAGNAVATLDYREREMLVPLPTEGMTHVPDGDSVVSAVREALQMLRERPRLGEENIAHLERYFKDATYSRSRGALWERFKDQLM